MANCWRHLEPAGWFASHDSWLEKCDNGAGGWIEEVPDSIQIESIFIINILLSLVGFGIGSREFSFSSLTS